MKFMSLFSGIGGFDLGLERAGMECVAQCDNDAFCNKVLAKHWPGVTRYDDVQAIGLHNPEMGRGGGHDAASAGGQLPRHVDLICGGFPCQDLSVAGKRAGLDGARSGLWFEFHRILSELRPAVALIENVPGLLSSNQGRDFGVILDGLEQLWPGRWGWAVLDSQHFGVAQRRRRLYVIAGPARERIAEILSLCESGDWNTQARRAQGEDVASTIRGRSSSAGVNEPGRGGEDASNLVLAGTVSSKWAKGTGGPSGDEVQNLLVAHSLRADGFDASEDGTGRGTPLVVRTAQTGANGIGVQDDMAYTLDGTDGQAVAWEQRYVRNGRGAPSEIVPPLKARSGEDGRGDSAPMVGVRRLTPVECERLQGFPDGWTQLDDKTADGPRYKALGNAVTVPVIEYIGRRIAEVLA